MNISKVPRWLFNASLRIIEHINDDHSDSIVSTLNAQHGIKVKMLKWKNLQLMVTLHHLKESIIF